MLRRDVIECMAACNKQNSYKNFSDHEQLVGLSCIFDCEDYETEVTFAVPIQWLLDYIKREWDENWDWPRLQEWLRNEYTSEDSQSILEQAITENQVVFWNLED